ncbi:related to Probable family 17 glucosidase SCW4 [Hanseniaspora guilliermondii]|uniref:Related to Probable family 17 glucosidase SCW4 n=1 Tax=Hanseniaspora guilliermondii TaxID=56406 RepID=A0A1L0B5I1_9ASCO|nr:related to Probable family 17 glucosidase SCW4 [Hanseniaspora guilliermondii]
MKFSTVTSVLSALALIKQATAYSAKGISYSPYTDSGDCKTASEVASDLAQLTDFEIIRLYGTDCNQVENVLAAKSSSQTIFQGLYYMDQISSDVSTISAAISSTGASWSDFTTISVGNELVNDGEATVDQVAGYVQEAKSALTSAGYTGDVVAVDTFIAVINNPGLCELSDYIAVNAHAYFDYNTAAADAGPWVLEQIQRVWYACDGQKNVLITETGWPYSGETYGAAVASEDAQSAALTSIQDTCGNDVFLFSAFDHKWASPGAYGIEQYFGIIH